MDLSVRHLTRFRYDAPAWQVAMRLRLRPADLECQAVLDWEVTVDGRPVTAFPGNAFGDGEGFVLLRGAVEQVEVLARGVVRTTDRFGVVAGFRSEPPPQVFLRATPLTRPDAGLAALAAGVGTGEALSSLHLLAARVREGIRYVPGSTTAATSAAEALAQGRGVCQDQTHAFIAAARVLGIPARYVAGYLLSPAETGGETHAWAEAWVEGLGWVGFDPTHGLCTTDHHVRLCCGLDADDAAPIKGSVYGAQAQGIRADVIIEEAGLDPQRQQQQ